ncbi:MAG TPA: LLM class flavin-dependent oxidoreductase, partial [Candidatus Deferrimicrobium sp.]|nr:LLM class flavin-dependent oxidoreductase [Candidatus Deferrimicrobium sp.]
MDLEDFKIGVEATSVPPFKAGIESVKKIESLGYDSVWWFDHIMNWIPESIWTPDITELAKLVKSPHELYDPIISMAVAAWSTKKIQLGTAVTETVRKPPAALAQTFLTLDHLSKGRVILGIGAGVAANLIPYGMQWSNPVSRLEESIKIIRLLWETDGKVDFDGTFWKLKDAVLGLKPYKKTRPPPIWIGAHETRMLELTGRLGDGWLPVIIGPEAYGEKLKIIRASAKKCGRDPTAITPSLYCLSILDEQSEVCHDLLHSPLMKIFAFPKTSADFKRYGTNHPLGQNFVGNRDFIPSRCDRATVLNAIEKVPLKMLEDMFLLGTPDEIISRIEAYIKLGLKHIILCNVTYLADIQRMNSS